MPDGLTLVPWCAGKHLTWDVTAVSTLVDSYGDSEAREAGAPAEQAALKKSSNIQSCHNHTFSNQLLSKMLAFITALPFSFSMPLAVASVHLAAKNVKIFFFSNEFLSPCNVSTPFFHTTVLFAMVRTSSQSSCF